MLLVIIVNNNIKDKQAWDFFIIQIKNWQFVYSN